MALARRAVLPLSILLLAVAAVGLIDLLHRQLVFFPDPAVIRTPAAAGLDFQEVYFSAADGVKLHGWFVPAPVNRQSAVSKPAAEHPAANLTILWFHGNAGNIGYQVDDLLTLRRWMAANIFIFDYRGYGNSGGRPSEQGIYQDARAAWRYLLTRPDVDPQRIILYGRSLGTAVAVELAAAPTDGPPPYAVILYSPLTSLRAMAQAVHPRLPIHWLAGGQFNSLSRIGRISSPILIIHSAADEIIPVEQGRQLFAAAPEPKQFLYPDAPGHNDVLDLSDTALGDGLAAFLNALPGN